MWQILALNKKYYMLGRLLLIAKKGTTNTPNTKIPAKNTAFFALNLPSRGTMSPCVRNKNKVVCLEIMKLEFTNK